MVKTIESATFDHTPKKENICKNVPTVFWKLLIKIESTEMFTKGYLCNKKKIFYAGNQLAQS